MKKILLNPGPANTTITVKNSLIVDDICHREDEFISIVDEVKSRLLGIVNADNEVFDCVLFTGSGTLAMEACISTLVPKGKKILFLANGFYTRRAVEIATSYNIDYVILEYSQYESIIVDERLISALQDDDIFTVYTTHHETGTGLINDIELIGKTVKSYSKVFVVDTISSFAMVEINLAQSNVDFIMSSSQKGISAMPGLAFVIGKKDILENGISRSNRNYYCNLFSEFAHYKEFGEMRFTPPVQIMYSVKQALIEIEQEGIEHKIQRHNRLMKIIRKGIADLGFEELIREEFQSNILVAIKYPKPGWDFNFLHDYCYTHGVTIYPGKSNNNPYFRLSVFGAIDEFDIQTSIEIISTGLRLMDSFERFQ